jgi:hypothetical protein
MLNYPVIIGITRDYTLELEFTLQKIFREPIPIETKSAAPEIPGSNPGRRTDLYIN